MSCLLSQKLVDKSNLSNNFFIISGELNIVRLARDGRDMYAVRCESRDYRRALAQLKAQDIKHIIVDTDPKHLRLLSRAVSC